MKGEFGGSTRREPYHIKHARLSSFWKQYELASVNYVVWRYDVVGASNQTYCLKLGRMKIEVPAQNQYLNLAQSALAMELAALNMWTIHKAERCLGFYWNSLVSFSISLCTFSNISILFTLIISVYTHIYIWASIYDTKTKFLSHTTNVESMLSSPSRR